MAVIRNADVFGERRDGAWPCSESSDLRRPRASSLRFKPAGGVQPDEPASGVSRHLMRASQPSTCPPQPDGAAAKHRRPVLKIVDDTSSRIAGGGVRLLV